MNTWSVLGGGGPLLVCHQLTIVLCCLQVSSMRAPFIIKDDAKRVEVRAFPAQYLCCDILLIKLLQQLTYLWAFDNAST